MLVFTITLERIATGERGKSLLHRCETEAEARRYAETLIATLAAAQGLRVAEITSRPA